MKFEIISYYRDNANDDILQWQRRVFSHFHLQIKQCKSELSHGEFLTDYVRSKVSSVDVIIIVDIDCIPLTDDVVPRLLNIVTRKPMLIGCAQQADHIEMIKAEENYRLYSLPQKGIERCVRLARWFRGKPPVRFHNPLIYAGPCFLVVPSKVYYAAGQPTFEATVRADCAGELTIACREQGIPVRCIMPTHVVVPKYRLGDEIKFGLGTTYGRLIYHAFESTYKQNVLSQNLFITKCKEVLGG